MTSPAILVLGVGNILLSDEGTGVRVVEALQDRFEVPDGVELLDGGTCGMDLLDVIADRDRLILVDVVDTGSPPGTVVRFASGDIPAAFRTKSSPHQLGLADVLAMLTLLGSAPKQVTVIGVQPESFELGLTLSPTVAERFEELVALVRQELLDAGAPLQPRRSPTEARRLV